MHLIHKTPNSIKSNSYYFAIFYFWHPSATLRPQYTSDCPHSRKNDKLYVTQLKKKKEPSQFPAITFFPITWQTFADRLSKRQRYLYIQYIAGCWQFRYRTQPINQVLSQHRVTLTAHVSHKYEYYEYTNSTEISDLKRWIQCQKRVEDFKSLKRA